MTDNEKEALVAALGPIVDRVRRDVCWKKTDDGPRRVDEALTDTRLAQHVNGGPAYGAAPIRPGESVTMLGVLDFDSHKGGTPWPEMQATAARVARALEAQGGRPVAFRSSGGHGIHLYCLWAAAQDAYSVRMWLRAALAVAGLAPGTKGVADGRVEVFPKQDAVGTEKKRFGNMFILPLAGASVPLDPFDLDDLPRDYLVGMDWPMSAPVPVLEKPERTAALVPVGDADAAVLESALGAIKNEDGDALDYDQWRDVIFAIHHATAGADYGLELAHQFSARSSKYDPDFLDNRVWPYIDNARPDAVTVRTVLHMARQAGWQEPAELVARDFDVVEAPRAPDGQPAAPLPAFKRDDHGNILATIDNLAMAARDVRCCNVVLRYDDFRAEIMAAPADAPGAWRQFEDADYTRMQIFMERGGFKKITKEALRDAVWLVAIENRFDSAIIWARGLKWDGVPRVEQFLERYCGVKATPYARAVSRYMWSALAGRALEPGAKADMVPVLIGPQGARKSSGVAAMVPWPELFAEMDLADRDAEASRRMRGRLVIELAELKGLYSRDAEAIKAFISRRHEEWRPLYKEFNTIFPRRNLFIGTANVGEFLSDDTGERRWLPVVVGGLVDVEAIERDRLQLWAEGCAMFQAAGVDWYEAETLARDVHGDHKISDSWAPVVEQWLTAGDFDVVGGEPGPDAGRRMVVQTHEVLIGALGFDAKNIKKGEERRVAAILKSQNYALGRPYVNGKRCRAWVYEIANAQDSANTQDFADLV
ncbi:PriCT-2 domain-containing protein [Achromobacter xylosoxidans]|uniref:VapE domain-containing protein n=1 Tax=Alcaligenes xylosoxydans xylosoxydans TaxID=85698 RepID=UPI00203B9CBD|nr:VapE domain-containing protein [Achromobacter xylosoxidans]MCM2575077.1 PriCT-2 domain-containing protein [Achromobacter xylosoxidans]